MLLWAFSTLQILKCFSLKKMYAIKLPRSIYFQSFLIVIGFVLAIAGMCDGFQGGLYYVRFDIRSKDNRLERSNLLMIPADGEYRAENFFTHVITGSADNAQAGQKGMSLQTRAEHNAIKLFLEHHGLESVKSQSATVNGLAHSETVVSYEGAIWLPYKRISHHFDSNAGLYTVSIEVLFAPLAFPDRWEDMALKYKINQLFRKFFSFF